MKENFSVKDMRRPKFVLALNALIAFGMVIYGSIVLMIEFLENGFTGEFIESFFGGWAFFLIIIAVGIFLIWYGINNMQCIIYRNSIGR